jgi:hypothetical protein
MADIVTIELGFGQKVAAEALKNIPERQKCVSFTIHASRVQVASGQC